MPSSPTFPMSSCLINGGGRTYILDLEMIAKTPSPSPRSSHSSPLSTLSESSTSASFSISTKRARAPRKRPNQSSAEAAALLSTISPKLFSPSSFRRTNCFPVLLPSFPILDDASLLLREPPPNENKNLIRLGPKFSNLADCGPPHFQFQDPGSPDFDAESILDEEVEKSIDSIMGMGSLSMSSGHHKYTGDDEDYLKGLGGFRFGLGILSNMRRALKRSDDDGEWWRSPIVTVKNIVPKLKELPLKAKKKEKKKEKVEKERDEDLRIITAGSLLEDGILKPQLGLKLNYDDVLKDWSGDSPYSGEADSVKSAANVIARLVNIDLLADDGTGVMREASIQRYKEKRRNRLFSKKIRYQVRKVNADQRPRMKGRFLSTPSHPQEAMAEESQ